MENEVVREDSDVTERRTWSAAEAALHPALGIRPAKSAAPLARVPRASVAPPPVASLASETVVTPAPRFDDVARTDDPLDDLVELSSQMLIEEPEIDDPALELGDDEVELLPDDLLQEVDDANEISDAEVLEEVDSGLLAYVETRGEITDRPRRAPSAAEVSSVSLASLAESLHNQAIASGMATYSTGVPTHTLDHGPASAKTLPIRRIEDTSRARSSSALRNGLFGVVFLAGIGAGVFFGMPSGAKTKAATSEHVLAPTATEAAATVIPADENAQAKVTTPAASVPAAAVPAASVPAAATEEFPVVEPLVETHDVVEANDAPNDDALAGIDVRPLEDSAVTETTTEEADEKVEPVPTIEEEPARVIAPARKARSKATTDVPPSDLAVTGSADPGVLMLGAKPPCEIQIDGKDTGLSTPQRVLRLPPGKHKVTLVNQEHNLRETFRVSIRSGRKTRVVRDMTSKIK